MGRGVPGATAMHDQGFGPLVVVIAAVLVVVLFWYFGHGRGSGDS
jgi:hypothetical protein